MSPSPELYRLAATTRALVDQVRRSDADPSTLLEADALLRHAIAKLEPHAYDGPYAQSALRPTAPPLEEFRSDAARMFPYSPVVGPLNPISPLVELTVGSDHTISGRARFEAVHCGAPGLVHGGWIAAALDEILGFVSVSANLGAMTGTLTIRYRRPTPACTELRVSGRLLRHEGRKLFVAGTIEHADTVCAEAEGVFIRVGQPPVAPVG